MLASSEERGEGWSPSRGVQCPQRLHNAAARQGERTSAAENAASDTPRCSASTFAASIARDAPGPRLTRVRSRAVRPPLEPVEPLCRLGVRVTLLSVHGQAHRVSQSAPGADVVQVGNVAPVLSQQVLLDQEVD